jgi:hypothetical protein
MAVVVLSMALALDYIIYGAINRNYLKKTLLI